MQIDWKKRIAKLTSNALNPFLVSFIVIILISFESTSTTSEALKWSLISIALSILPVFAVIIFLVRNQKLQGIFIKVRRERNRIYLLATVCAVVSCVVLYYTEAPLVLVASFAAGLSAIIIFMSINLLWKISVHTAFVAGSITVLIVLYGASGAATAVLLPLLGWSRIELEHHSPAQVAAGALLAALIVVVVFHLFGLIGPAAFV